jgi:hypothetical protein
VEFKKRNSHPSSVGVGDVMQANLDFDAGAEALDD